MPLKSVSLFETRRRHQNTLSPVERERERESERDMEKLLVEDGGVKTLEPSMVLELPRFRRSHLKSATFRTLVRILSYCLDESSLNSPKPGNDSNLSPLSESQFVRISNQEQCSSSSFDQDQTKYRNPKPINPQIDFFCENAIPREETPDQLVKLGGGDELERNGCCSVSEVLEPVSSKTQIEVFCEKGVPFEKLGQIARQETPDLGGGDELKRNGCSVSEVLKPVSSSTQIEIFCEKRIPLAKLGQITRQETADQLVKLGGDELGCNGSSVSDVLKPVSLSLRKAPDDANSMPVNNRDSSFCLEQSSVEELGQEMQQRHKIDVKSLDHFDTITNSSGLKTFGEGVVSEQINGSFRIVVADQDVEDSRSIMDEDPKSGDNRNNSCSERIVVEELGLEMEQEGLDMKILECSNNVGDSFELRNLGEAVIDERINGTVSVVTDQEIEDGEILDELGDSYKSLDLHVEHVSDDLSKEDEYSYTCTEQKRADENEMACASYLLDTLGSTGNCVERNVESRKCNGMEFKFNTLNNSKTDEVKLAFVDNSTFKHGEMIRGDNATMGELKGFIVPPDGLGLAGEITEKVMSQDQGKTSTVKEEGNVREKKKRTPLTKERKAKKKLAEKRKRAEKNKKLGVKRLKLLPILKPQKVNYCNFYLKGRCQQGDTCKFSHDTTPLTKSQPCKYFATQSCLKGEDCPFDHNLSKYPCHNYMLNGTCSRGSRCKFSHKMPNSEVLSVTSNASEQESPLLPDLTNSTKKANISCTSSVAVNKPSKDPTLSTPFSMEAPLDRCTGEPVAAVRRKPPEGITFLSFGQVPMGETSKQQQDNSSSKKNDGIETCDQQNQASSEKLQNSNEIPRSSPVSALTLHQSLKSLANGHMNSPSSDHTKLLSTLAFTAKHKSDMMMARSVRPPLNAKTEIALKSSSISNGLATPCAGRSHSGSMDASKILEEFLFNGCVGKQ